MKIFIICGGYDYEGYDIKAVVATREEADALVEKFQDSKKYHFDTVTVQEWTVGEVQE